MNNIKRYRHIATILISLVGFVAFPTILISCSSNSSNYFETTNTIFETNGNVNLDTNLSKLLPSEAKLIENKNHILTYIFENLIIGKKDKIFINSLNVIASTANDIDGTLDVTYTIQNYWVNDIEIMDIKSVRVILKDFVKKTTPTEFKNTLALTVTSDVELAKLSTNELNNNESLLQKFLFANEIFGNKESLDFTNVIILDLINGDSAKGTITISYQINKYWSSKGITTVGKNFSINLSDFKKAILTPEQILQEINQGGAHQGLNVDKFLPIVEYLDLSNKSRLNSLNDLDINSKIKLNPNFANIQIEINSGNQKDGTLSLKITGSYKNINIPADQIINISGFYNSIDNYHPNFLSFQDSIYISEIDFNFDSYFKNLQTDKDIETWTSKDWIETYLSKMIILKYPVTTNAISFSLLDYYKNKIFEDINFKNVAESIDKKSWKNLIVDVSYANYQFNFSSKIWEKIIDLPTNPFNKTFSFKAATFLKFNVPDQQNTIDWIAKFATSFDSTQTSQYFASYWYSLYQKNDLDFINGLVTIEDKYKTKYFFNENLVIILDSMNINDLEGTMHISYKIDFNDSIISAPSNISTTSFKKLSEFVDAKKSERDNLISIKVAGTPQSSLAKNVIKSIKSEFTNDQLNTFTDGQVVNMTSAPVLFKNTPSYRLFNGYDTNINTKLDEQFLATSISALLFGKQISRTTIDVDKNLFIDNKPSDNTGKFIINYIFVNVENNVKPTLSKNGNSFLYKVPFKYLISIEGDSAQSIEINSYYSAILLKSDLGLQP